THRTHRRLCHVRPRLRGQLWALDQYAGGRVAHSYETIAAVQVERRGCMNQEIRVYFLESSREAAPSHDTSLTSTCRRVRAVVTCRRGASGQRLSATSPRY